jgi:hypothetical protein
MADDKKKPAAPPPSTFGKNHYQETLLLLVGLFVLSFLVVRVRGYFELEEASGVYLWAHRLKYFFLRLWELWQSVALFIVGGGILLMVYSTRKARQIGVILDETYGAPVEPQPPGQPLPMGKSPSNEKWELILKHLQSENSSDWRLAIMEADIMLEELLKTNGYHGEGVGEMLMAVEPSDMLTLDKAWEGHKVRNRIAHSGTSFELNEREAKRVISLFESVFKEFQII